MKDLTINVVDVNAILAVDSNGSTMTAQISRFDLIDALVERAKELKHVREVLADESTFKGAPSQRFLNWVDVAIKDLDNRCADIQIFAGLLRGR